MTKNYREEVLQGAKEKDHYFVVNLHQSIKYGENGTIASEYKKKYQVHIQEEDLRIDERRAAENDWFNHFEFQEKTY